MRDGTATRQKLERCALDLFVRQGINATTIKDIANAAQIAEGTLYRHYTSKDDLAAALYLKAYKEFSVLLQNVIEQN
ncbi:MAG TPA: helix-turn-helix domain-containing protein, partial [Gammaproteobacteria bacterium]|nr:helix-turn-helix domain-containing protein [Gammaproteobacteria bacterium]